MLAKGAGRLLTDPKTGKESQRHDVMSAFQDEEDDMWAALEQRNIFCSYITSRIRPQLVQEEEITSVNNDDDVEPCPITVLTGFLGAGKTTLLEY
jgi:hypothetical protein